MEATTTNMELVTRGGLDNDTRGWIMCIVSGIACVFGASVICVDSIIRLFPGKRNFRIEESNVFLACSLSLSFGVMLFSALYSMLPEAKEYFADTDWSDQTSGLVTMAAFVGGFIGIQAISRILHQFMPSHVVDCDHSHDEAPAHGDHGHSRREHDHDHEHADNDYGSINSEPPRKPSKGRSPRPSSSKDAQTPFDGQQNGSVQPMGETTPLLADGARKSRSRTPKRHASNGGVQMVQRRNSPLARNRASTGALATLGRRQSMLRMQKRVMSFVKDTKCNCDASGPCYGYTDPCGRECFKHLSSRSTYSPRQPNFLRTTTGPLHPYAGSVFLGGRDSMQDAASDRCQSPLTRSSRATSRDPLEVPLEADEDSANGSHRTHSHSSHARAASTSSAEEDLEAQHHHHVPTNAFLSIGLQTSIAIALHKFPEGFITYATNHANPSLGFNVFMALFVHNITEGFAMALPLYMAIGSRWRAVAWSAALGGLSQPIGAGVAVIWFKVASRTHVEPDAVAYAILFACTSGIMVSVALQLFVESLSLNHNRNMCIFCGFLGMAILGFNNALLSH